MKYLLLSLLSFLTALSYAQNVGIGTASPGTKLDVNGAMTYRETSIAISANTATISSNISQVRLTGAATATISVTMPTPPNAGQVLVIYNNITGGYAATVGATAIPAGVAMQFTYSNGAWITTAPASTGSSSYIQNQTATSQTGAGFNTAGTGTIAGTLTLTPMTLGSVLFAGTGGVVSQNNANLFWDNTNTRLGIGTTGPEYKLHVISGNSDGMMIQNTAGGGGALANIFFSTYADLTAGVSHPGAKINAIDDGAYSAHIAFNTKVPGADANAMTERVRITSAGVVKIANLAGTGYRPVYADASGNLYTISGTNKIALTETGGSQSWTVPAGVNIIYVKVWGAGGGSGNSNGGGPGGGGGFVSGYITVTPGASLTVIVGQGGTAGINTTGVPGAAAYAGGGQAGQANSGGGGGYSGIFTGSPSAGTALVVAGGGGGDCRSAYYMGGGGGGGLTGAPGNFSFYSTLNQNVGYGGAQNAGGGPSNGTPTVSGSALQGGEGSTGAYSGGGGGGWYGGGGGGNGSSNDGAGAGGSSYIGGLNLFMPIRNEQGNTWSYNSGNRPPAQAPGGYYDPDYTSGIGMGAATISSGTTGIAGGNGYVVIYW